MRKQESFWTDAQAACSSTAPITQAYEGECAGNDDIFLAKDFFVVQSLWTESSGWCLETPIIRNSSQRVPRNNQSMDLLWPKAAEYPHVYHIFDHRVSSGATRVWIHLLVARSCTMSLWRGVLLWTMPSQAKINLQSIYYILYAQCGWWSFLCSAS